MIVKGGEYKKDGKAFLGYLNEEVALQVAMLADASREGLHFVRGVDDEETDFAQMFSELRDYLLRLETLFVNEQCLQVCGFTKFMLQTLEQPMQWVVSSRSKTFGGSGWDKDQIIQRVPGKDEGLHSGRKSGWPG